MRDRPELDAGRGRRVAADAVGTGDVAALQGTDGVAVDEPGEGVLLPVDLRDDDGHVSSLDHSAGVDKHIRCSHGSC